MLGMLAGGGRGRSLGCGKRSELERSRVSMRRVMLDSFTDALCFTFTFVFDLIAMLGSRLKMRKKKKSERVCVCSGGGDIFLCNSQIVSMSLPKGPSSTFKNRWNTCIHCKSLFIKEVNLRKQRVC